jgi:hypothetical protein
MRDTQWQPTTLTKIDWPAINAAMQKVPRPARITFAKNMFQLNRMNYLNNKYYKHRTYAPVAKKKWRHSNMY